ncbi:MAG: DUF421 domain-containing protein [Firmicutes bacterium]|nr:DUF421 domain-containing protein [Bacillota bacterium]
MINIILRVIIVYVVIIGIMRLMGKRQLGELEPFELVIALIIADLAVIPMSEQTIPLWYGIVPLVVIAILHFCTSFLSKTSPVMRDIISGKPAIVMNPDGMDFKQLGKLNISAEELCEMLRNMDYFDISDVNYAIIERNGKVSVIPKSDATPLTREDMKVEQPDPDIFFTIVENGRVIKKNIKQMGLSHLAVIPLVTHNIEGSLSNILLCNLSNSGDVFIQTKDGGTRSFTVDLEGINKTVENVIEDDNGDPQEPEEVAKAAKKGAK